MKYYADAVTNLRWFVASLSSVEFTERVKESPTSTQDSVHLDKILLNNDAHGAKVVNNTSGHDKLEGRKSSWRWVILRNVNH